MGWGGAREGAGRKPIADPQPRVRKRPEVIPEALRKIQARPLGPRWYVVELAYGAQRTAVLRDISEGECRAGRTPRPGYRAEMPMIGTRRLLRGVWTLDQIPMFGPSYAFVQFDAVADEWAPIQHIDGIARLFMTRTLRPIPLPVGCVEWLVETADTRLQLRSPNVRPAGQKLLVATGPFQDLPAVVLACDGVTTTADVKFFGRDLSVTLPYSSFVAAEE